MRLPINRYLTVTSLKQLVLRWLNGRLTSYDRSHSLYIAHSRLCSWSIASTNVSILDMDDRLPKDSSPANSSAELSAGHDPLEGVTSAGMIVTGAHRSRVPVDFKPVIDKAVERLGSFEGAHSLYVYGSVATGTARVGYSDVDLVTVGLDAATSRRLGETLSVDFPKLCRGVEVGAAQASAYWGSDDKAYGNRVFLRHYCVHLAGPDIGDGLPDFPADQAAARGFNGDIGLYADRWRTELLRSADPGRTAGS